MLDPTQAPLTLPEMLQRSFVAHVERPCLGWKPKGGAYQFLSYGQVALRARNLCGALLQSGLERGERVAIWSENRVEWALADLACQMSGLIAVPLYSTLPPGQIQHILADCGAKAIFCGDEKFREKIAGIRAELPQLIHLWNLDEIAALESAGETHLAQNSGLYEMTWPATLPDDVATIIYTSGTTGQPKGVMLSHRNFLANIEGVRKIAPHLNQDDVWLSFLPLAHVYERTAGHFLPFRLGASIAYTESLFTVDKNLGEVAPTIMTCVPRLCESTREKLFSQAKHLPPGKKEKYLDALNLAQKAGMHRGRFPGAKGLGLVEKLKYKLYDGPVYSEIRKKFGGRLKHFISGGAPMAPELGGLFFGLGLEILEGYGLTETSPVIAVNLPFQPRLGTVGPPLPGVSVKIAPDGEILAKGDTIMRGYWNKTAETEAAIDPDGWFHTGDIGVLDDGWLRITDRKKDLIILANGKNVAPAPLEIALQESPFIEQAVVLGDKQKAVSALIVPRFSTLRDWAKEQNIEGDEAELAQNPEVLKKLKQEIELQTQNFADFEKIKRFAVLREALSVQNGELTPTLKVKRRVVAEKYGALVGD